MAIPRSLDKDVQLNLHSRLRHLARLKGLIREHLKDSNETMKQRLHYRLLALHSSVDVYDCHSMPVYFVM